MQFLFEKGLELTLELIVLAIVFTVIEKLMTGISCTRWYRRKDCKTDVAFYFFNATVTKVIGYAGITSLVIAISLLVGFSLAELDLLLDAVFEGDVSGIALQSSYNIVSQWPLWGQVLAGLLIADFFSYWGHRAFHISPLWQLHSIHHSPEILDWLSSARSHPLNDMAMTILKVTPLLFLGFSPTVFIVVTPIIALWSVFTHANINCDFGWFKYLFITPRFHRWHHTSEREGIDKNFAGLFPVYDIIFGTWYMPDEVPTVFGAGKTPIPAGFKKQILFPFRKAKASDKLARDIR